MQQYEARDVENLHSEGMLVKLQIENFRDVGRLHLHKLQCLRFTSRATYLHPFVQSLDRNSIFCNLICMFRR